MHAKLALSAAALTLVASTNDANASMSSGVRAAATTLTDQSFNQSGFAADLEAERLSARGAHGYAMIDTDFAAGIFRGRNHGCAGGNSLFQDKGIGTCGVDVQKEPFTVTSGSLAANTPVSITFCYSYTSDISGTATFVGGGTGNGSSNSLRMSRDLRALNNGSQQVFDGTVEDNDSWTNFRGSGDFLSQSGSSFTVTGSFTVLVRVGFTFDVSLNANSRTASWLRPPQGNHTTDGSAGFALTFGVGSMTSGANLQWQGQNWTGSCADSTPLVPENPVPAPGTAAALAGLTAWATRRRRN